MPRLRQRTREDVKTSRCFLHGGVMVADEDIRVGIGPIGVKDALGFVVGLHIQIAGRQAQGEVLGRRAERAAGQGGQLVFLQQVEGQVDRRVDAARGQGFPPAVELSENAEYHSAKEKQQLLQVRLRQLEVMLKDVEIIEEDD